MAKLGQRASVAAGEALSRALAAPRIRIERVTPQVDGGYPARAVVGQRITVEADIYLDGHDTVAAELLWYGPGAATPTRERLAALGNDRFGASFVPLQVGLHYFCIEAAVDVAGTVAADVAKKAAAGTLTDLDRREQQALLEAGARDPSLLRRFRTRSAELPLDVERPRALFASWYEMFPRSAAPEKRHGTFDDVIAHLPEIRAMGFDVLYFPPIHPIGRTNRKGRNNSLTAGPNDPGSPYAIGAQAGGHEAVHPELGGIEAFRRLRDAAVAAGLELALDFAVQCSPDHPWLKEHPEWFAWRADGSLRHAENPPKKYEDIVNPDFYAPGAMPSLWVALRDIVEGWVAEGVKIFRVDNPHTKPLPFWEWLIGDIRGRHPDVIFLSEAFTRPAMMQALARLGFSQSYTYFTWRTTKGELTEYLTELTQGPARDFYRPHFFVNTPDINPYFLQSSGRPGFLIRAALAATLSGLWGVYSGFEACEAAPVPGKEEYLDSEKYQLRRRRRDAPGNIVAEIAALNRIRHENAALQTHLGLAFYSASSDQVLCYGKRTADLRNFILVLVSLDPAHEQSVHFEAPLWEFGLTDDGALEVEELVRGQRFTWRGKIQHWLLKPELPFAILRVRPAHG